MVYSEQLINLKRDPQGGVFSPTVFLIMINAFPQFSNFTSPALFVDDSNIWRSGTNIAHITRHLQDDLNLMASWCKE